MGFKKERLREDDSSHEDFPSILTGSRALRQTERQGADDRHVRCRRKRAEKMPGVHGGKGRTKTDGYNADRMQTLQTELTHTCTKATAA